MSAHVTSLSAVTRIRPGESVSPEATMSYRPSRASSSVDGAGPHATAAPRLEPVPRFIVREVIGTGGYGTVHEAVQTSLSRVVALKRLHSEFYDPKGSRINDCAWLERLFRQEAVTTGLLEHPNIVPIHELSQDEEGRPLLALKLVRGKTWDVLMNEDYSLLMPDFLARHLQILIDVAQATAFAHSRGIVHRDLKPQQVMVGEFGEVLLMDWGLAVAFDDVRVEELLQGSPDIELIPKVGVAESPAGSPSYMAPEQTDRSSINVGPWTDVFLLGGMLYTILTALPPHRMKDLKSPLDMLEVARKCEIVSPEQRVPDGDIPPELSSLCMRAMAKLPEDRVKSAAAFVGELHDFLSGAGKRRESIIISDAVKVRLSDTIEAYAELSACDAELDRSLSLWPANPEALHLRQVVLMQYTQLATANDDLTLARVQAERLVPSADRDELLTEIQVLEQLNARESYEAEEAELNRRETQGELRALNQKLAAAEALLAAARDAMANGHADPRDVEPVAQEISRFLSGQQRK